MDLFNLFMRNLEFKVNFSFVTLSYFCELQGHYQNSYRIVPEAAGG